LTKDGKIHMEAPTGLLRNALAITQCLVLIALVIVNYVSRDQWGVEPRTSLRNPSVLNLLCA